MANDLTGDYDVVAAFSLGAVDRVLAAMHRGNRLPHSLSMAVDDLPNFRLGVTAASIVDIHGEAVTDVSRVKRAAYARLDASAIGEDVLRNVDPVVNWRPDPSGPQEMQISSLGQSAGSFPPIGAGNDFSYLAGVAQLQLGPPTMQLARDRTDRAEVHTPVMIRYYADDQTRPLSVFMRGETVIAFGVRHPAGRNIVVDLAVPGGNAHFSPFWSANSLDSDDRAAIDKALTKSVRNSFQPSTTPMPANLLQMHFKGFPAAGAVAAMMNVVTNNNPSPASVQNVFLRPEDHFALVVNGDLITGPFTDAVNRAIDPFRQQQFDTRFQIDYWIGTYTFHIYTNVTVLGATVELLDGPPLFPSSPGTGLILLTIPVQVRFGWKDKPSVVPDPQNFDFTVVQAFTLTLNGRQAGLARWGGVAVNIPASVPDDYKNPIRGSVTSLFDNAWNSLEKVPPGASKSTIDTLTDGLSAEGLQKFLRDLMNPSVGSAQAEVVNPDLAYTSFEIKPQGIVLHGSLAVPRWPSPHAEFDKDPWAPSSKPEYRALRSWIPGGTIQEYQWSFQGGSLDDTNRFVTIGAPALTIASNRICLTFSGSRITASGPVAYETVYSQRQCKWTSFPIWALVHGVDLSVGNRPHVAVPRIGPTPEEKLEIVAHASPWAPEGLGGGTANLIVHFPDNNSARQLDWLLRALANSGRTDTVAAILCVLTPEQLSSVRALQGLMYADDAAAWERLLGIRGRPATVVLSPSGKVVWRHEGEIGGGGLTKALRAHLAPGGQFFPQFVESPLRIGQPTPNFVFESEGGERLTLRKLAGRPLALLFWRSTSAPSVATLRNLHKAFRQQPLVDAPLIVAINDGEDGQFARGLAAGEEGAVLVVPDPARQIARAYGVGLWPTTIFLDADGAIRDIRLGLISVQDLQTAVGSRLAEASQPGKES